VVEKIDMVKKVDQGSKMFLNYDAVGVKFFLKAPIFFDPFRPIFPTKRRSTKETMFLFKIRDNMKMLNQQRGNNERETRLNEDIEDSFYEKKIIIAVFFFVRN